MKSVEFNVPAISCGHCVKTIEMELGELEGVVSVSANLDSKKVRVEYDQPANEEKILDLLASINYPAAL
jgi:copper chaperone